MTKPSNPNHPVGTGGLRQATPPEVSNKHLAKTLQMEFTHSRQKVEVDLDRLEGAVVEFLDLYGAPPMVDPEFHAVLGEGDGEVRFRRLLKEAHKEGNAQGFFQEILQQLEGANDENPASLHVNGVRLPYQLGLTILKEVIPGDRRWS